MNTIILVAEESANNGDFNAITFGYVKKDGKIHILDTAVNVSPEQFKEVTDRFYSRLNKEIAG